MRSKPQVTYADDSRMKSCKFCYAEIHARARVCPLCGCNQTLFGTAKGLIVTTFSVLTALASLGLAVAEKMEKFGITTQLASVTASLKVEEAKSEAATQAVDQLTTELPDDVIEQSYIKQFGETPSVEKLNEIEEKLSNEKTKGTINREEMIELQKQRIWLRKMRGPGSARTIEHSAFITNRRPRQTAERPRSDADENEPKKLPTY